MGGSLERGESGAWKDEEEWRGEEAEQQDQILGFGEEEESE